MRDSDSDVDTSWADDFEDDGLSLSEDTPGPSPVQDSANDADALARLRVKGDDAASNTTAVENANTGELGSAISSRADADETGYLDFSVKSPWEKLARSVERAVRGWLASSESALAAASSPCDRPEHGGRHLRCLRARVDHATHWRRDPYSVLLYYPPGAPPNVLDRRVAPDATSAAPDASFAAPATRLSHRARVTHRVLAPSSEDLGADTSGVQRWFGLGCPFAVVEPPFSFGSRFSDVDEASAIRSAVSDGFESAGAPAHWPIFAPVHGPARGAFVGRADGDGWAVRLETDSLDGASANRARARTLAGLAETTRERLAATGAVASWNPADDAHADDAHASARLTFPTDRRWIFGRRASGLGFGSESGSESDERGGAGAAFMALADGGPTVARRRRARASDANANVNAAGGVRTRDEWDDYAPWSPWSRLADPWDAIELDARWRDAPLRRLLSRGDGANALSPTHAPEWILRAIPTGASSRPSDDVGVGVGASLANEKTEVKTEAKTEHGVESSDGRLGLAEMYYKLSAAASSRATLDAETMGRLASEEFWDDTAGPAPRAPPEAAVQDVLRDVFDTNGGEANARRDASGRDEMARARLFPNPPRSAPPESLLARVAMHALCFGNVRAVAVLWRRFVREIRFAHWDRGVSLPRVDVGGDYVGSGTDVGSRTDSGLATSDAAVDSSDAAVDSSDGAVDSSVDSDEKRVLVLEAPDVRACLIHQKLQLINACIRRRKVASVAAFEASEVSKEGPTPLAGTVSVVTASGWNDPGDGWEGADDWNDRTDAAGGTGVVDDDIDLTSLLGSDAAPTAKRRGGEEERSSEDTPRGDAGLGESLNPEPVASAARDDDEDVGFETASDDGDGEGLSSDEPAGPPEGVRRPHPAGLRLLRPPHAPLNVPVTQLPPAMTEDMMHEREAAMHALGDTPEGRALRVKMQSDLLISDMSAFKAANPGSCLADFVRWHSPRDWIEDDVPGAARVDLAPSAPKGALSARMREPGNVWGTLWRDAPRASAASQRLLFDPIREGEKALHFLENVPPPAVFAQLLAAAAGAVGHVYASADGATLEPAPEALERAANLAARTLARPCPRPAEHAAVAGELQRAERVVARAESLAHRLPGVPRRVLEAILRDAAEKDDARECEDASANGDGEGNGGGGWTPPTPSEAAVVRDDCEERRAVAALLPPGTDGAGAEAATVAEYVIRVGGGRAQTHRAHVVAAPCFLRVSAADAYPY